MHRAHVDDRTACAAPVHVPDAGARGQEGTVEMDRQHLLPLGEAELLDRLDDLDAGIGNEDIDLAELPDDLGDTAIDFRLVGDIHGHADRLAAGVGDFLCRGLRAGQVEIGNRDRRAILRIDLGDALANAAGGAGDQGDLAFELHGRLLDDVGMRRWRVARAAGIAWMVFSGAGFLLDVAGVRGGSSEHARCAPSIVRKYDQSSRPTAFGSTPRSFSLRYRWVRSMPTIFASLPTLPPASLS